MPQANDPSPSSSAVSAHCQRFYESDCQGRTSSALIASVFFPAQSALTVLGRTRPSAVIELSSVSSASVLSVPTPARRLGLCVSARVVPHAVRTMVLSETRSNDDRLYRLFGFCERAYGFSSASAKGLTPGRSAERDCRSHPEPRTHGASREGTGPHRAAHRPALSTRAASALLDHKPLRFSTDGASARRASA